jgi:hypothetical protein
VLIAGAVAINALSGTARAGTGRVTTVASVSSVGGQQSQQCRSVSAHQPSCSFAAEIQMPLSVSVAAGAAPEQGQQATIGWTVSCSVNGGPAKSTSGGKTAQTPFSDQLTLPKSEGGDCTVNSSVTLNGSGNLTGYLNYTLAVQVEVSVPTNIIRAGAPLAMYMCMTDSGDSTKAGTRALLEGCTAVYAGGWTYNGKLIGHRGMCLTDPHNGGVRTGLVLERCTGAADQSWSYTGGSDPELKLKAYSGRLCLDDPKYSTKDGTPLIVYTCNGGPDEEWVFSS